MLVGRANDAADNPIVRKGAWLMANGTIIDGRWLMRPVTEYSEVWMDDTVNDGWLSQEIPGHWQQITGLETYTGKMVYRKAFDMTPKPDRIYRLRINGVFYKYRVFLNRFCLGGGEGYFTPAEFDITSIVRAGSNTLFIEVESLNEPEGSLKTRCMGAYNGWLGLLPHVNPGGIWQPVELIESGMIILQSWNLWTEEASFEEARLSLKVNIDARVKTWVRMKLILTPLGEADAWNHCQWEWTLRAEPTASSWETKLTVNQPLLWWSWDLGNPSLYRACLQLSNEEDEVLLDSGELTIGIRRFELRNYIPYLNGRRFLAKGANYAPGDIYPVAMTPERFVEDLQRAKAIHLNMLRVYSHVEAEAFYEVADKMGILLWQDTALLGRYRTLIKKEATFQTKGMVERLGNHPSVVVWCLHEEPCGPSDFTTPRSLWEHLRPWLFSWNRDYLDRQLKVAIAAWDGTRPVVANTGARGWRLECDGHLTYGWMPGYGPKRRFEAIRRGFGRRKLRFVTQMGVERPEQKTIHYSAVSGEVMDWQRTFLKKSLDALAYERQNVSHDTCGMMEAVDANQREQAELIRYFVDRLRYHKYQPTGGILGPFLHAPYASMQLSLLSYDRTPALAYSSLGNAFRPVYVFTLLDKDIYYRGETVEAPIYLASDLMDTKGDVEIKARLMGPSGDLVWKGRWVLTLTPDMETLEIARASILLTRSGNYKLHLAWNEGGEPVENEYSIPVKGFNHHKASL